MFGEEAAENRAERRRDHERRRHVALIFAAIAGWNDVGDNDLADRTQAATAEALQCARGDQQRHRVRQSAEYRRQHEDGDRDEHDTPAPVMVTQAAIDRRRGCRSHEIGRDDPCQQFPSLQVVGDCRQTRRDNRLVQIGQEQRQHETEHDRCDVLWFEISHPIDVSCEAAPVLYRRRAGLIYRRGTDPFKGRFPLACPV